MDRDRYIWLVARKLSGVILPHEEIELDKMMETNPDWLKEYHLLEKFWNTLDESHSNIDVDAAYHCISERLHQKENDTADPINKPGRTVSWRKWIRGAAAVLLFLLAGGAIYWFGFHSEKDADEVVWKTHTTPNGKQQSFVLTDGTKVRLNVGSTLRYPDKFNGDEREVFLSGEAYFEVKRDTQRPFRVFTNNMIVRVLGTVFDVKAYPGDRSDETSLVRGSIQVTLKNNPSKQIVLKPNEKLVVKNEAAVDSLNSKQTKQVEEAERIEKVQGKLPLLTVSTTTKMAGLDSTVQENAWVENKLAFRDEDFSLLSRQMERWYNVEIEIKSDQIKNYRFSGIFTYETIEQALKALQLTEPFSWQISGNKIIIDH